MDEGNENNPDVVLEENKTADNSQKPSEFENVYVLIMLGLLGIAVFLMIIMFAGKDSRVSESPKVDIVELGDGVKKVNGVLHVGGLEEVPGRNKEELALSYSEELGRYYSVPKTGMTLYRLIGTCENECLSGWVKYLHQLNGEDLYLYNEDRIPGVASGVSVGEMFEIAKP